MVILSHRISAHNLDEERKIRMKQRLCLVALTLVLGLTIVQPTAVFATNTQTEQEDTTTSRNNDSADRYQQSVDKWNKLTDSQKQEVFSILANRQKADIALLDKLVELGVIEKADADSMKSGLNRMYKEMTEKGEFPIMRPRNQK